jgi:MoaA/NifB/PqqE/SkfB family radical SAM enzyme
MQLDKRNLYRLPWSMNDNPIAWLEVTDVCNIRCEGCYRQRLTGHKPLEQIKEEILFFKRWRNPDNVSIAGGEPLVHPQIMEIVSFIAENGIKPIILTNARALTPEMLRELKRAGLAGFTVHIDSHQNRPGWEGKTELEHNALRQHCADMIAAAGGLYAIYNATVYPSTYHEIPDVLRWGQANLDKVSGLVFITYRTAATDTYTARDTADRQVDLGQLSYASEHFDEHFVTGPEVIEAIQTVNPFFEPSGYLGGSVRHDSFKWLAGAVIGSPGRNGALEGQPGGPHLYGAVGKQTMEVAQAGHHILRGRYLAYLGEARTGAKIFLLSPWDRSVRRAAGAWLRALLRQPSLLARGVYMQSVGIIQAPDVQTDGRADMCDSCPDMTVWDGQLINSCRMDEYRLFGGLLSVVERDEEAEPSMVKEPA